MNDSIKKSEDSEIDLLDLLRTLLRHKTLIVGLTVLFGIFGFIANLPLVFVSTTLGYLTFFEKFWTFNLLNLLPIITKVILAFILPFNDLMDLFHIIFFYAL